MPIMLRYLAAPKLSHFLCIISALSILVFSQCFSRLLTNLALLAPDDVGISLAKKAIMIRDTPQTRRVTVITLLKSGHTAASLNLLESPSILGTSLASTPIREALAVAYAEIGDEPKLRYLHPTNLFSLNALFRLSKDTQLLGNLKFYSQESLVLYYPYFAAVLQRAMDELYQNGLWDNYQYQQAGAYIRWQKSRSQIRTVAPPLNTVLEVVADLRYNDQETNILADNVFWHMGGDQGIENKNLNALFVGGIDPQESPTALRVMNLWEKPPLASQSQASAEFVSKEILLKSDHLYTLTLQYKTDSMNEAIPLVAFLEYTSQPRFVFVHDVLPQTDGEWRQWQFKSLSPKHPIPMQIILRNWGKGSVWFDNLQLMESAGRD